jgi:HAD superfamily hydrolase (TIGR01493 family)
VADAVSGAPIELQDEPRGVLFDLLMAVMDSPTVWEAAARSGRGLPWRDAVTARMIASNSYVPFEDLVIDAAGDVGLPPAAADRLFAGWPTMQARPDATGVSRLEVSYAFVTNTSRNLAELAARRSRLSPAFTLSAEEAGCYKPDARIYRRACAMLGTPPASTLFVAGAPYDAAGARRAGLNVLFVHRRLDQKPPPGIPTISSLEELGPTLQT